MDKDYELFQSNFFKLTGIQLSAYKESQMKRRLITFYEKHNCKSFSDLFSLIQKDNKMLNLFLDHMTINVTEFFRDKNRWDVLEKDILPSLLKKKGHLKIWSAACSTGQEPYSLSLLLSKYLNPNQYSILATDLDKNVLDKAKQGVYKTKLSNGIPTDLMKKHCTNIDEHTIQINDSIKNPIQFKQHNLLKDAYPKNIDLIVCRNVLIYFTEEAKNDIYQNFSTSLSKDGILFIGSTEQIFTPQKVNLNPVHSFFYNKS